MIMKFIFQYISKDEVINITRNSDLKGKIDHCNNIFTFLSIRRWIMAILIMKEIEKDCQNKHVIVIIVKVAKSKEMNIIKTTKKDYNNKEKLKISTDNFLIKKKI